MSETSPEPIRPVDAAIVYGWRRRVRAWPSGAKVGAVTVVVVALLAAVLAVADDDVDVKTEGAPLARGASTTVGVGADGKPTLLGGGNGKNSWIPALNELGISAPGAGDSGGKSGSSPAAAASAGGAQPQQQQQPQQPPGAAPSGGAAGSPAAAGPAGAGPSPTPGGGGGGGVGQPVDGSPSPAAPTSSGEPSAPGGTTAAAANELPPSVVATICGLVRAAGYAPLRRGQEGYAPELDPDGNGLACE